MFFPFGFKVWMIGLGAFILGLFGLYRSVKSSGRKEAYREVDAAREISRSQAAQISHDLEIMEDEGLAREAQKWTREKSNDE